MTQGKRYLLLDAFFVKLEKVFTSRRLSFVSGKKYKSKKDHCSGGKNQRGGRTKMEEGTKGKEGKVVGEKNILSKRNDVINQYLSDKKSNFCIMFLVLIKMINN